MKFLSHDQISSALQTIVAKHETDIPTEVADIVRGNLDDGFSHNRECLDDIVEDINNYINEDGRIKREFLVDIDKLYSSLPTADEYFSANQL